MNKETLVTMYRAYARPHIECCVHAWNPYTAKDIDSLEMVTRIATKLVSNMVKLTNEESLRRQWLHSLYCRRQRGDLIETFIVYK